MKSSIPLLVGALMLASLALSNAQNVVILIEEDYEDGGGALNAGNPGAMVSQVADPAAGGTNGTVAAVDIGGAGQWGEIRGVTQNIPLPPAAVPGTDTFVATVDVFIDVPNTTFIVGEAEDRFNLILRFNSGTDNADRVSPASANAWETLPANEWTEVTVSGTLPDLDNSGAPITHVLPIISLRDQDDNALAGTAAYFDNFKIEVSVPDDDPNLGATSLAFGQLVQGEGPHVGNITLSNSGVLNTLTVAGAMVSGDDAAQFAVTNAIFPFDIAPGATTDLEVTFDPGFAIGVFSAMVDIASNDENDDIVSVVLSAEVLPPFNGEELIINGDFESGDLTAWRDNDRFDFAEMPTHSGEGAAVFNLSGSQEWGEARINGPSPPTTFDDPQAIEITPEMIGKPYEYSAWYFRPAAGGMATDDTIRTIFRWNKSNTDNHTHGFLTVGNMPVDTWIEVTGSGMVPELGGDGLATTSVVPLWSFQDVARDNVGGEIMYIDDVSFKIESPPAPPDLVITGIEVDTENDVVSISWRSVLGATYALDRSTQLSPSGAWLEQEDSIVATGTMHTYEDAGAISLGEPRLFYRVRLVSLP